MPLMSCSSMETRGEMVVERLWFVLVMIKTPIRSFSFKIRNDLHDVRRVAKHDRVDGLGDFLFRFFGEGPEFFLIVFGLVFKSRKVEAVADVVVGEFRAWKNRPGVNEFPFFGIRQLAFLAEKAGAFLVDVYFFMPASRMRDTA